MNITKLSNLNFKARFLGKDYKKIKNMSITNGLSVQEAKTAEDKIHEAFPKYIDQLEIKSKYNSEDGTTTLDITLYKPEKKFGNGWYKPVLERDYTFETKSDEQVKNLYLNLVEKILAMKKIYLENLQNHIYEDLNIN